MIRRAAGHQGDAAAAAIRFWAALARIGPAAALCWLGWDTDPRCRRTSGSPTGRGTTTAFFAIRQAYLATARLTGDVLAAGGGDTVADAKAELAAGFLLDALAPTNFLLTNPAAIKRAFETGGACGTSEVGQRS